MVSGHTYEAAVSALKERLQRMRQKLEEETEEPSSNQEGPVEQAVEIEETIEQVSEAPPQDMIPQFHIISSQKSRVKQQILILLREGRKSTKHLKEMVVDDQQLCSKASFYRYIKELRKENRIDTISISSIEYCVER